MSDSVAAPPSGKTKSLTNLSTEIECPGAQGAASIIMATPPTEDVQTPPQESQAAEQPMEADETSTKPWSKVEKPSKATKKPTKAIGNQQPAQAGKGETSSAPTKETAMAKKLASTHRSLFWADDEDDDRLSDPCPDEPEPSRGTGDDEIRELDDYDIDDAAGPWYNEDPDSFDLDKIVFSDDNPSLVEKDGHLFEWHEEKRHFVYASRANAIVRHGPRAAPGMWSLARIELPSRPMGLDYKTDDNTVKIKGDCLMEHIATWKAFHTGLPKPDVIDFATSAEPDSDGMFTLTPKGVVALVSRREEDERILLEKNNEFRMRLADHCLSNERTQRYSLKFVQAQLATLTEVRESLAERQGELDVERRRLEEDKAKIAVAKEQSRFCDIQTVRTKVEKIAEALRKLDSDSNSPEEVVTVFEAITGKFQGYLDKIEKSLCDFEEKTAQAESKASSAEEAEAKAAKALAMLQTDRIKLHAEYGLKEAALEKNIADRASAATFELYCKEIADGEFRQAVALWAEQHMPQIDEEAYRKAQNRFTAVAKEDPRFVLDVAKEAFFKLKDEKLERRHRAMIQNPTAKPKNTKSVEEYKCAGRDLGIWLFANDAKRLRDPRSRWYKSYEKDHELSLTAAHNELGPYWVGLDAGSDWALAHPQEASRQADIVHY
ncbi:Nn.00g100140.m01.CDS01 [Neocucurbitaria sp. VM-36]